MKALIIFSFVLASGLFSMCTSSTNKDISTSTLTSDSLDRILVNQVGYYPNANKIALLRIKTDEFNVMDANTGEVVFTGKPGPFKYWDLSGDSVCTADFSTVTAPGQYRLCVMDNSVCSYPFSIEEGLYSNLAKASLKSFYLRPAGHPDTAVFIHASAASKNRPEGFRISSAGGWYDAGDYNKYIVNSSITTYTLLLFCQMYPDYVSTFNNNIPESGNAIPDVMDELLVNLRWMLTMQDPADGGVYHKLTNKEFGGFTMPDKATEPRYVVYKTTAAALDFTATMAMASRVFAKSEDSEIKELGKTCLNAARKAYAWALANPKIYYKNPADIKTGEYGDITLGDENFWAASELGLAENNVALISIKEMKEQEMMVPSWDSVGMLGVISMALTENTNASELKKEAQKMVIAFADKLVGKSETLPYKVSLDFFKWGSNSDVSNLAIIKLVAFKITSDKKYIASIQRQVRMEFLNRIRAC